MEPQQPTYTEFLEYQLAQAERVLRNIRREAHIVHSHDGFADSYTHIDALVRIHQQAAELVPEKGAGDGAL